MGLGGLHYLEHHFQEQQVKKWNESLWIFFRIWVCFSLPFLIFCFNVMMILLLYSKLLTDKIV